MKVRAKVPCGPCRACCISGAIILHPEDGDLIETYDCEPAKHPFKDLTVYRLKHKPNGECVYLGPEGCTIHDRAPAICKGFDCRKAYVAFSAFSRPQRRQLIQTGLIDKAILDAGRERMLTVVEGAA